MTSFGSNATNTILSLGYPNHHLGIGLFGWFAFVYVHDCIFVYLHFPFHSSLTRTCHTPSSLWFPLPYETNVIVDKRNTEYTIELLSLLVKRSWAYLNKHNGWEDYLAQYALSLIFASRAAASNDKGGIQMITCRLNGIGAIEACALLRFNGNGNATG